MWLYLVFEALIYHITLSIVGVFYVSLFLLFIYFEVIHPLRFFPLSFCIFSLSKHDAKLDVFYNAKLLFYGFVF